VNNVIFSSWAGNIIDNTGLDPDKYGGVEELELPLEVRAFMGWDGIMIVDDRVNIVDMAYCYLKEVQKFSCGECTVGYIGIKVMVDILDRIMSGEGREGDIDLLQWLGAGIKDNAKCDFCTSAVTPLLDTINYYKQEYLKLITGKTLVSKSTYIARVTAPCMEACPAHQDIPGYIELIRNRRYEESLSLIRKTNCLPEIVGRACVAPCEINCRRANIDSPIAIRALKRFVADYEIASGLQATFKKAKSDKQRVAVIGAGPAGLAASYNLALKGYKVTIYDELSLAGGMAVAGIPPYRLPREVINREVKIIQGLGVEFKLNTKIGKDITLDGLFSQGFKAIFIATGAHIGRELGIEANERQYEGLVDGVQFLHDVNIGKKVATKNRVIIIGGGNVAIDCARTCLRLGFKDVTIVYRRSRTEMPASREEVEEAEKEGAKITFLATPVKILTKGGKVVDAECVRMELGKPDASGRKRPVPIPGSEFIIETDMIISAIGEQPDLSFIGEKPIKITEQGTIEVDHYSCQTSQIGIFSGGDCVTGPATLIDAIAFGNRTARSIDQYLTTGHINQRSEQLMEEVAGCLDLVSQRDLSLIPKATRQSPEQLPVSCRAQSFDEVEKTLTPEASHAEAERCLHCYRVLLVAKDGES